jgi:hypothetical protein
MGDYMCYVLEYGLIVPSEFYKIDPVLGNYFVSKDLYLTPCDLGFFISFDDTNKADKKDFKHLFRFLQSEFGSNIINNLGLIKDQPDYVHLRDDHPYDLSSELKAYKEEFVNAGGKKLFQDNQVVEGLQKLGASSKQIELILASLEQSQVSSTTSLESITQSDLVVKIKDPLTNKILYAKVDKNVKRLEKEFEYLRLLWSEPLARPITIKPFEFRKGDSLAALVTSASYEQNCTFEEQQNYLNFLNDILTSFSNKHSIEKNKLSIDPYAIEIVNTALTQAVMRHHQENSYFNQQTNHLIYDFNKLKQRVDSTPLNDKFNNLNDLYNKLRSKTQAIDEIGDFVVADLDARYENLFLDSNGNRRVRGDRGLVTNASSIYELGKKRITNPKFTASLYAHATNKIESHFNKRRRISMEQEELMAQILDPLRKINLIRLSSFKASIGQYQQADSIMDSLKVA